MASLGLFVGRTGREGSRHGLEGRVQVSRCILVEPGDLVEQLDLPRGVLRAPNLNLVHADELLEVTLLAIQRLQDFRDRELVLGSLSQALEGLDRRIAGRLALEHLSVCLLYTSPSHETVLDLVCRLLLEKKKTYRS